MSLTRVYFVDQGTVDGVQYVCPLIKIEASGSGYCKGGVQLTRNCQVKIETFHSRLVSGVAK